MAIPWVTIIMALLSFFLTKAKTGSTSKAVLAAGLVGGATYAYTHSDYAAGGALASYDGVSNAGVAQLNADGQPIVDAAGNPVVTAGPAKVTDGGGISDSVAKVLTSWGATGTSAVIGTTAVATNTSLRKYIPWIAIGAGLLILTR